MNTSFSHVRMSLYEYVFQAYFIPLKLFHSVCIFRESWDGWIDKHRYRDGVDNVYRDEFDNSIETEWTTSIETN